MQCLPDTHCHLAHGKLLPLLEQVLARADSAGVKPLINVGIDLKTSRLVLKQREKYPWCHPVVGNHPHRAKELAANPDAAAELASLIDHPHCLAVGESGLDFHYNFSPPADQKTAFHLHAELAGKKHKPLVVHSREAFAQTLAILDEHPGLEGVIHCFTGGPDEAAAYLERGFYLSFSGLATWKGQEQVAEAARICPADKIMLETDAPFLSPDPVRGRRCEPGFLIHTLAHIARVRNEEPDLLAKLTMANATRLFRIPPATNQESPTS